MDRYFHFLPPSASNHAPGVDALAGFILCVCVFFTVLIATLVIYFAVRYRRNAVGPRALTQDSGHSAGAIAIEIIWSVIPLMICAVMFFAGARVYLNYTMAPEGAMEIHVVGRQWMWDIQQPTGYREKNELHVPLGEPVKLILTSQDVIHDFFVPAFRVHQDVVPGRYTVEWFTPTRVGQYHFFCSQYCGAEHTEMGGTVYVMEKSQYVAWLAGTRSTESPRSNGERIFRESGCVVCHASRAPSMAGLYGRQVELEGGGHLLADEQFLHDKILAPNSRGVVKGYPGTLMPAFREHLSEEQVMDLIAFIKSLSGATSQPYMGTAGGPATQPDKGAPGSAN